MRHPVLRPLFFFFSSRRRHTRFSRDWSSDVCSSDLHTWRITCNVREVNGVLAAVRAGIGVAVFPQTLMPADLVQIPSAFGLPPLGDVDFSLVDNPSAAREPVEALASAIMGRPVQKLTPLDS